MNRKAYRSVVAVVFSTFAFLTLAFLTSCSSSSSHTTPPPVVAIAATSGGGQSATVGAAFTNPLTATVTTGGTPTANVTVTFTAPGSGATGTFAGGVATATAMTNSSGVATSPAFTAGTTAGAYNVVASATGATSANFGLTNTAGAPTSLAPTGGASQNVTVGTGAASLVAQVKDTDGNPVPGISVTFTAPASGASGTFTSTTTNTETDTTDANGNATAADFVANSTLGGPYNVVATSGALTPVNFALTNIAPVPVVAATSGSGQSATVSTAFAAQLVATVTIGGAADAGVVVTFTAPSSGASGTFADSGTNVTTATTDGTGKATSAVFTANATSGGAYNVVATAPGAAAPANFSLTNTAVVVTSNTYVFYLSGLESINSGPNFYVLAGAVTIDSNGNVTGGEQDYNDAFGLTSPEPSGDTITGGTLTVDGTGQGTLTLITNNASLGVSGTETLAVQFANTKHALITQFDGTATSSGSLDWQTPSSAPAGNFAYALSGVDKFYGQTALGGVFTLTGLTVAGVTDQNDPTNGGVVTNQALNGTLSGGDAFGRGSLSIVASSSLVNYYIVGPEVIRIIGVDKNKANIGSAFGQGSTSFTNASLGTSVFGIASNSWGVLYDAVGMFATTPGSGTFLGVADDDEGGAIVSGSTISGTYSIASDGYGSLTITNAGLGSVGALGIYMTDPALNLNDPNNTSAGSAVGGALVLDLDSALASGTGVLVPQTDTSTAAFANNTYVFGAQQFNGDAFWEMDFVGQGTVTAGALAGTGLVSDPGAFFSSTVADTGVTFSGTPLADGSNPGRYSMLSTNTTPNQLVITVGATQFGFNVVLYQASGSQLFWMQEDTFAGFIGPLEQQGSLTGLPAARKPVAKTKAKHKQ